MEPSYKYDTEKITEDDILVTQVLLQIAEETSIVSRSLHLPKKTAFTV